MRLSDESSYKAQNKRTSPQEYDDEDQKED